MGDVFWTLVVMVFHILWCELFQETGHSSDVFSDIGSDGVSYIVG